MDTRPPDVRSRIMQSVGTKNTGPELLVRRTLFALGYRYRLHSRNLPGRPDLVFPARRKVIFVHGCFWHGHDCSKGRPPKSRPDYWLPKIEANRGRDAAVVTELAGLGWKAATVWQCELRDAQALRKRLKKFLGPIGKPIDFANRSR